MATTPETEVRTHRLTTDWLQSNLTSGNRQLHLDCSCTICGWTPDQTRTASEMTQTRCKME